MGMYTEIFVNVDLVEGTPENVINTLKAMCGEEGYDSYLEDKPSRWSCLFFNMSYYTPYTTVRKLTFDEISNQWSFIGKGDIKNYEGEIKEFFKWIKPYVDGDEGTFIGYSRYEESEEPTLHFK